MMIAMHLRLLAEGAGPLIRFIKNKTGLLRKYNMYIFHSRVDILEVLVSSWSAYLWISTLLDEACTDVLLM